MAKQKLNLYIDEALIQSLKIEAILEKCSLSAITEKLYLDFLAKRDAPPSKAKRKQ